MVEPRAKSLACLRSQADFWNQYDGLFSKMDYFTNCLDVNFGLAASRDPMQQNSFVLLVVKRIQNGFQRGTLRGI